MILFCLPFFQKENIHSIKKVYFREIKVAHFSREMKLQCQSQIRGHMKTYIKGIFSCSYGGYKTCLYLIGFVIPGNHSCMHVNYAHH